MALKKVRTSSSGSKSKKARYVTRAEAKGSARKHRRVEDAVASTEAPGPIILISHGSLVGIYPARKDDAAWRWLNENLADGPRSGKAFFVELRYLEPILDALREEGFEIDG